MEVEEGGEDGRGGGGGGGQTVNLVRGWMEFSTEICVRVLRTIVLMNGPNSSFTNTLAPCKPGNFCRNILCSITNMFSMEGTYKACHDM